MLNIYRGLDPKEKALVWVAVAALVIAIFAPLARGAGLVAGAQVAAALGTFVLAVLAFYQVREMRKGREAQERPHVIVDTDHSERPSVYVVLRNIGQGAARNITFEFSAPLESSEIIKNPNLAPINEQPYFARGMDYLAPGAEISCFWDIMPDLAPFLRDQGLDDGITVISRYESLAGKSYETEWTINPLLVAKRVS